MPVAGVEDLDGDGVAIGIGDSQIALGGEVSGIAVVLVGDAAGLGQGGSEGAGDRAWPGGADGPDLDRYGIAGVAWLLAVMHPVGEGRGADPATGCRAQLQGAEVSRQDGAAHLGGDRSAAMPEDAGGGGRQGVDDDVDQAVTRVRVSEAELFTLVAVGGVFLHQEVRVTWRWNVGPGRLGIVDKGEGAGDAGVGVGDESRQPPEVVRQPGAHLGWVFRFRLGVVQHPEPQPLAGCRVVGGIWNSHGLRGSGGTGEEVYPLELGGEGMAVITHQFEPAHLGTGREEGAGEGEGDTAAFIDSAGERGGLAEGNGVGFPGQQKDGNVRTRHVVVGSAGAEIKTLELGIN